MKLADLLLKENPGLGRDELMLMRHAEKEVRLLAACGGRMEELTAIQPIDDVYDFLRPGYAPVKVLAVVFEDRVHAVYEVGQVLKRGPSDTLGSPEYARFEHNRKRDDGTPKQVRECRRYALEPLASGAIGEPVKGWEGGRSRTPVQRMGSGFFEEVLVDAEPITNAPVESGSADLAWVEGTPALRTHLRRERAKGLAKAKKAAFRHDHGKLFCEECKVDPVKHYGTVLAEACIEVHHSTTQVREMQEGHQTRLRDLKCLCANCHRLVHERLRLSES